LVSTTVLLKVSPKFEKWVQIKAKQKAAQKAEQMAST